MLTRVFSFLFSLTSADTKKRDAILSYRRVGGSPVASKLPMFANTMIAGGLRLMLPTARVCLIYRGRTLGRAKSSTAPLGSEPTPTCRCNDAPQLPPGHAPFCPSPPPRRSSSSQGTILDSIVKIIHRSSVHPSSENINIFPFESIPPRSSRPPLKFFFPSR